MGHNDVQAFIESLLGLMQIKVDRVEVVEVGLPPGRAGGQGGHPVFTIVTEDSKILIGHQGETLRALNLIVRRAFEDKKPPEELKFRIDVNGYYADRDSKIVREARQLAERARLFKYDIDMRPLNPYERMIVHEALRDFGDITTESQGEGAVRHIVICYRPAGVTAPPSSLPES
jgi:spoIIIJ-associated protein